MVFVSRAGEKLQFALDQFNITPKNLTCADFGSSTGGFVDCLLQNRAKKVYSVDTAYGELAWKLRRDPRVIVVERTNAMHVVLPPPSHEASEGQGEKMDLITIDVGWTKQKHILPNAFKNLKAGGVIISLIKPHYEIGKGRVKEEQIEQILEVVQKEISQVGGKVEKIIESPILGEKGKNREFLALIYRVEPTLK
jgi:23S rRNA (cytidine1920-2'-O)/16S rRNA (cytidine1409-2'-O)-methyltransferase